MKTHQFLILSGLLTSLASPGLAGGADSPDKRTREAPNPGDWCAWLQSDPGEVHRDPDNPWLQRVAFSGRFDYHATHIEGTDVNGLDFNDRYDEYRRARLGVKVDFLHHFKLETALDMVADDRFRDDPPRELDWGYDRFHEAFVEFDATDAFGIGIVDNLDFAYGRMKLRMGAESHQSSNNILTIERSSISDKLSGEFSRPTGFTVEIDKGDWELTSGVFSAEEDADFLADWSDGQFYYASLEWQPSKRLTWLLDYAHNNQKGQQDALGYAWAGALSGTYDAGGWGITAGLIVGENEDGATNPDARRQGSFHGFVATPWYWVIEDRLQLVAQYQYASSEREQGLQLRSRHVRAAHDNPLVDVDNGRGSEHHSIYLGANYHLCPGKMKVMAGVSYDRMAAREGRHFSATTMQTALRISF